MSTKYTKFIDGELFDMPESETAELAELKQRELLEGAARYRFTQEDFIRIMASQISVTLPSGNASSVDTLLNTDIELPRKLGYKWVLNGSVFVLVEDPEAIGTSAENAIIYYEGVPMIDNAFYDVDGVSMVCMNGQLIQM